VSVALSLWHSARCRQPKIMQRQVGGYWPTSRVPILGRLLALGANVNGSAG
jgi:hypothetical protein